MTPRSRPGRTSSIIRTAAVALVLGAVVVVASAWAISLSARLIISDDVMIRHTVAEAMAEANWQSGHQPNVSAGPTTLAPLTFVNDGASAQRIVAVTFGMGGRMQYVDDAVGWPRLALGHTAVQRQSQPVEWQWAVPTRLHSRDGSTAWLEIPNVPDDRLPAFPLRPLWPGFAVNTLVFAAPIWPLLLAAVAARRALRRRRGRCAQCNYDRRGLASPQSPCPECGHQPRIPFADDAATGT